MKIAIRSLALVLAVGVSACSKTETQTPANNTTPAANETPQAPAENTPVVEPTKVETPVVETPAPTASTGVVATWVFDSQASLEVIFAAMEAEMKDATPEQVAESRELFSMIFSSMQMELTLAADNTVSGFNQQQSPGATEPERTEMSGTWSMEGEAITINTKDAGSERLVTVTGTLTGDTLTMQMPDAPMPMSMIFKRKS
jgi:hypothetical protein